MPTFECLHGVGKLRLMKKGDSQNAMGFREIRLELDRFFGLVDGPVGLPLVVKNFGEHRMGLGKRRVEADGFLELGYRFIDLLGTGNEHAFMWPSSNPKLCNV